MFRPNSSQQDQGACSHYDRPVGEETGSVNPQPGTDKEQKRDRDRDRGRWEVLKVMSSQRVIGVWLSTMPEKNDVN